MTIEQVVIWIVIGGIAGIVADWLVGVSSGLIGAIIIGILGALIGCNILHKGRGGGTRIDSAAFAWRQPMSNFSLLHKLLGEWQGTGRGEFPTIEPFEYQETLRFDMDEGRELIHYEQKTQRRTSPQADYVPSHWESGFIRPLSDNEVEVINVQGGGRLEVMTGSLKESPGGLVLLLRSKAFSNDPRMLESERAITLNGTQLHYRLDMRTTAVPHLTHHVEAVLTKKVK